MTTRIGDYCEIKPMTEDYTMDFYDVYHDTLGKLYSGNTLDVATYKAKTDYRCFKLPTETPCINLHYSDKFDKHDYFTDFWSDVIDGRYSQGSCHTGNIHVGQYGFTTKEQCKEKAILNTLSYLSGNWEKVYDRPMLRSDICGEEITCNKFYEGYRWRTLEGALFKTECDTCIPNRPPGYTDSRPAGTTNYIFTAPDGTEFNTLDAAWNYYCKITNGETITMKTWIINTQTNLKGTVEQMTGYLMWHITEPIKYDVSYGPEDGIPATWVDEKGVEQVAVIKTDAWGKADVALDENRSFGYAEKYVEISKVDILLEKSGYTTQLRYPKSGMGNTILIVLGAGIGLGVLYYITQKKK